jgi:hypothetical protein
MSTNPAWRYYERDGILQQLIKDGVPITVENYISAVWRSELPESLTPESADFLAELNAYEKCLDERTPSPTGSAKPLPSPQSGV